MQIFMSGCKMERLTILTTRAIRFLLIPIREQITIQRRVITSFTVAFVQNVEGRLPGGLPGNVREMGIVSPR